MGGTRTNGEYLVMDLLPDCRAKSAPVMPSVDGYWVPVFCANCGKEGGRVPEEGMTFLFWLCNTCATTHGQIAGTMLMPDEVFFEKVRQEQLTSYGHYLTESELVAVVEADASPLATLLKQGR